MRNSNDEDAGYAALLACDASSGCPTSRDSLLVPRPLAVELNNVRVTLDSESPAEDFTRAAAPVPRRLLDKATRRRVLMVIGTVSAAEEQQSIDAEAEDEERRGQSLKAVAKGRKDIYEVPKSPAPEPPAVKPEEPLPAHGDVTPEGCYAGVVRIESFAPRLAKLARIEAGFGSKNTPEAVDLRAVKVIADKGPARLSKLIAGWRNELDRLAVEMPNFAQVIDHIAGHCMLAVETGTPLRIPPILLVGSPGVGKSYFAQRLAKALELPSYLYSLESAESCSVMLGSEKHWSSSEPGVLYRLIVDGGGIEAVANPVVVLDELDKAPLGEGRTYRPRDSLIPLLERSTSENLRDKCNEAGFDGSYVIYVATANTLSKLEAPILSRFDIRLISDLTPQQAVGVVRAMHDDIKRELRLAHFDRPAQDLVQELAVRANPRLIGRLLRQAFARAVARGTNQVAVEDLQQVGGDGPRIH